MENSNFLCLRVAAILRLSLKEFAGEYEKFGSEGAVAFGRRLWLLLVAVGILAFGFVLCWYRAELYCWYSLHGLARASDEDRGQWVSRVVTSGETAIPGLLGQLASPDEQARTNAEAALVALARHWGLDDLRTRRVHKQILQRFADLGTSGQIAALRWHIRLLRGELSWRSRENIQRTPSPAAVMSVRSIPSSQRRSSQEPAGAKTNDKQRHGGGHAKGKMGSSERKRQNKAERHLAPRHVRQFATRLLLLVSERDLCSGPMPASSAFSVADTGERNLRLHVLELAGVLLDQIPSPECIESCRKLIGTELHSPDPCSQLRAIQLALHRPFRADQELLKEIVPFLKNENWTLRRAAVLAVGSVKELITREELFGLLHDRNDTIRRLATTALRSRGLAEDLITLGKLATDPRARSRLLVGELLVRSEALLGWVETNPKARKSKKTELEQWLLRMTRDSSRAVRASAIRLAFRYRFPDIVSRIEEMVQNDPSPSVRLIAKEMLAANNSRN
ncbi:MAG: HEAT repeat domain-containing protein [Gemmataceae bacterium]